MKSNPPNCIIYDMPYDDYRAADGISQSSLPPLWESFAHYEHALANRKSSKSFELGSCLDDLVFDRDNLLKRYAFEPDFGPKNRNPGKQLWEKWKENLGDKISIPFEAQQAIDAMFASLSAHPFVQRYFATMPNFTQTSIFWTDPESGLWCKARLDIIMLEVPIVIDLKSSGKSISPTGWQRTLAEFNYPLQGAFYLDGVSIVLGKKYDKFVHCVVESTAPYQVAAYELGERSIAQGRRDYKELLRRYKVGKYSVHKGYDLEIKTIDLPSWKLKENEWSM